MHIEVLEEINLTEILNEVNTVKVALKKGWATIPQVGLQGHKPDLDPLEECFNSAGRVSKLQYPENYFKYPLWDLPKLNRIFEKYNMVRSRIMPMHPKVCYTMHSDMTKRIHIPLITAPDCRMVIQDKVYMLDLGKVYLTNTTLPHTAFNASKGVRVHIVGCIYE